MNIDRRTITLPKPIRALGTFEVPVRLHMDLNPTVSVIVEDAAGRYFAAVPEEVDEDAEDDDDTGEATDDAGEEDADAEEDDA